jgi:hypothetical protein
MELREIIARASCEGVNWAWPDGASDGDYLNRLMFERQADAILTALDAAGLVVVPRKATEEMCRAMDNSPDDTLWQEVWAEAVAASPFAKKEVG